MEKSETISKLTEALVAFHQDVAAIGKDSDNPFFKSKYASLAKILRTINGVLVKHGLNVVQLPCGTDGLTTILSHVSGEYICETMQMRPTKNDPQGVGSCITYMRRYALGAVLCLNIDKDDDGNKACEPEVLDDFDMDVMEAIDAIGQCDTIEQLGYLCQQLPQSVLKDARFIAAGKERKKLINSKK